MSLYQCENCGCCENTALGHYHFRDMDSFDWASIQDRKGKKLCSACAPIGFADGTLTKFGKWHGEFDRVFLPKGMFKTNREGNLEHIKTGSTDFRKYEIK